MTSNADPIVAQTLLPRRSEAIDVPGRGDQRFALRYLDTRSAGPPVLCVHGNPTWSFYYRRLIDRLGPTHRVIAVDHIGCGRSDKPGHDAFDYCLASHRDNLIRLIDHLDLRDATLVVHDWGGAIGLSALLKRRDVFTRLVVLNTGAFPPPYLPRRIAACRIPLLGSAAVRGANAFARAALTMAMSRNRLTPDAAAGLIAPYDSWSNRIAIDAFVRDIPMSRDHRTYPLLSELESRLPELAAMPILLVWGMMDWCFRPECLRRFQSVWPDATTVEIADAGHYVLEDAPTETLDAIAAFLQRTAATTDA